MPDRTIKHWVLWLFLNCCWILPAQAQYFDLNDHEKKVTIPFHLVRNMIVVKLSINNKGPFNFIMDTGVGLMIITDPNLIAR